MGTTLIEEPGQPRRPKGTTLVGPPGGGTRLVRPDMEDDARSGGSSSAGPATASDQGPVVGWLVIVRGPGRGRSVELGYGMNIIGRSAGNRVTIDFGDDQISADDHFRIAYDGQSNLFHLVPGRGTNLVYVGDQPLLGPLNLDSGATIKVGSTEMRFAALCGPDWHWQD